MNEYGDNHAPAEAAGVKAPAPGGPTSLSDRVRSLRLPDQQAAPRGGTSWLAWALVLVLAGSTGYLGFVVHQNSAALAELTQSKEAEASKPAADRTVSAASGKVVLESKGYVIPAHHCTKCGGLTEAWRIGWMAYEHNILLVPHGWNTAVGLAADLHLTAALPVARYVEYLTPSPYLDELVTVPFRPDAEGYLNVPTGPGLGIELNRDALKRFGG